MKRHQIDTTFVSSLWKIMLYDSFSCSFIRTEPKEIICAYSTILELVPQTSIAGTQAFINVEFCPFRQIQVGCFNFFSSPPTLISWSQSFLFKNLTIILSVFILSQWHDWIFLSVILAPMYWRTLRIVFLSWSTIIDEGIPTTSAHSRREYCAFF